MTAYTAGMRSLAAPSGTILAAAAAFIALAGISAFAVLGWAEHGEAIFLKLAQGAWINCF